MKADIEVKGFYFRLPKADMGPSSNSICQPDRARISAACNLPSKRERVRPAFMSNPDTSSYDYYLRAAQAAAASLNIELLASPVTKTAEITKLIENFARVPDSGLVVPPDIFNVGHRDLIIALTARHRLPAVYAFDYFVAAGGLMSYGTDRVDEMRQAAAYIDRILRGDKPSELPVQAPTKFETVINLKTAKELGVTIPPGLLLAADDVIE